MSECVKCIHLHRDPVTGSCDAYVQIPHGIWSSEIGHDELRGDEDHPVAFEQ